MRRVLGILLAMALPVSADEAGRFDYWILALSWSPTWCALDGERRGSPQCDGDLGWTLHGLWPQHERGYPEDCETIRRDPSAPAMAGMADIMGSVGLARHEWARHGRCSGLSGDAYLALSRRAFEAVAQPEVLERLAQPVRLPARVVEEAFLDANDTLFADAITVTCRDGRIAEARICLDRDDLAYRRCGDDVIEDCRLGDALLDPR